MSDAHLPTVLEAILFGAGRSMSAEELAELLEKPQTEVQSALQDLQATIRRRRDSALQLSDVAGRWISKSAPLSHLTCRSRSGPTSLSACSPQPPS